MYDDVILGYFSRPCLAHAREQSLYAKYRNGAVSKIHAGAIDSLTKIFRDTYAYIPVWSCLFRLPSYNPDTYLLKKVHPFAVNKAFRNQKIQLRVQI